MNIWQIPNLRENFVLWGCLLNFLTEVVFIFGWGHFHFLGEVVFCFWVKSSSILCEVVIQWYTDTYTQWYTGTHIHNDTQTHIHNDTQAHIYTMIHIDIDYVEKVVANHTKNTLCGEKLKYIFLCEENSLSDKHLSKICSVSSMNDRTAIL